MIVAVQVREEYMTPLVRALGVLAGCVMITMMSAGAASAQNQALIQKCRAHVQKMYPQSTSGAGGTMLARQKQGLFRDCMQKRGNV